MNHSKIHDMKIIYNTKSSEIGPLIITHLDDDPTGSFFLMSFIDNTILLESKSSSMEELIGYYSFVYGESWKVEDYRNPVDALLAMGQWFHHRDIYAYNNEVENLIDSLAIPSLNDSDRELIEYDAQHDEYMVRVYDQAISDARHSGYPLWISDAYYGIDLGMK